MQQREARARQRRSRARLGSDWGAGSQWGGQKSHRNDGQEVKHRRQELSYLGDPCFDGPPADTRPLPSKAAEGRRHLKFRISKNTLCEIDDLFKLAEFNVGRPSTGAGIVYLCALGTSRGPQRPFWTSPSYDFGLAKRTKTPDSALCTITHMKALELTNKNITRNLIFDVPPEARDAYSWNAARTHVRPRHPCGDGHKPKAALGNGVKTLSGWFIDDSALSNFGTTSAGRLGERRPGRGMESEIIESLRLP